MIRPLDGLLWDALMLAREAIRQAGDPDNLMQEWRRVIGARQDLLNEAGDDEVSEVES